jgi:glucose/arabinose dehydrogenase/uncharacterized membrane protein
MQTVTTTIAHRPIYFALAPVPITCFAGAFVTDIAYWHTASMTWETFSIWLITAGLVMAGITAVAGFAEYVINAASRAVRPAWPHLLGNVLAVALSVVNAFVHSRDGYTAVVPAGLILSEFVLLILLISRHYRRPVLAAVYADGTRAPIAHRGGAIMGFCLIVFCCAIGAVYGLAGSFNTDVDPAAQIGVNPRLPGPHQYLVPPMHIAPIARWENGETPKVPAGLKAQAFAMGLVHPRSIYVLPNGDVLVAETSGPPAPVNRPKDIIMGWVKGLAGAGEHGANRITLLRDTKGSGVPDVRTVFLDHLHSPFGMALVGNDFYVADTDAIVHFPYTEGQTSITATGTKLTDLPGGPIDHHWTKSLVASADGTKLYVGVGSNSNITENGMPAELGRASIWEVDRATGLSRIYASGLRNPTGLGLEPQSGKLWAIVNERDELGPNLVPDYLTSVREGAFYGWPYSYYGQHVDARVQPQRPDLVAQAIPPDYALSSHVAPLGVAFYTGTSLPEAYRGGAFVGEHGSWDRTPLNGYKVVFVPFSGGHPAGAAQDFVTGFLDAENHARGRPVGLAVDRTGALLVADDLGNAVWRVSAAK